MPELPEVETICHELRMHILNKIILNATQITDLKLRQPIPKDIKNITNTSITSINRRAKYIQIHLSNDSVLVIHLGMSGKLLIKPIDYSTQKHDHFMITLNNDQILVYNDPRRFGIIDVIKNDEIPKHRFFAHLGVEPLSAEFTPEYLAKILHNKYRDIKLSIMDNENIVGIGNIYAAESLFLSGISPIRPSNTLSLSEIAKLHKNIIHILEDSIKKGGSTLKDYAKVSGEQGYFQNSFNVYAREGQGCFICGEWIKRINQGGRSTFYCKICQK